MLDCPEIPLRTNGSENDVRCQVTRRNVSAGARSATRRDCRDGFLGLAKTRAKLKILFWEYLGARLAVPGRQPTSIGIGPGQGAFALTATRFAVFGLSI